MLSSVSHASRLSVLVGAASLPLAIAGCVRAPLDVHCIPVAAGDLVLTELRGKQANSSYRQWIEVYNASDEPVQLSGAQFRFTQKDGKTQSFFVREPLEVDPGAYVTLGGGDPEEFAYLDYDYTVDFHTTTSTTKARDLPGSGVLALELCGELVDRITYTLPASGTLALDGAAPPDAATNDAADPTAAEGWCADLRAGPKTGIGLPGSPQEANPPCV